MTVTRNFFDVFIPDRSTGGFVCCDVTVEDGVITQIRRKSPDREGRCCYLLPGLVDLHTHGCLGFDFGTATQAQIHQMCRWYFEQGVTSVVPTLITDTPSHLEAACARIAAAMKQQKKNEARILGIHLEGPFLAFNKRGAHDPVALKQPDEALLCRLQTAAEGQVITMTVDPAQYGALKLIGRHPEVHFSVGHTESTYEQATAAFAQGADRVTHAFNAMSGLHHRESGVLGAAFDRQPFVELIADGMHVSPPVVRMTFALYQKTVLVSDSICGAGAPDGEYPLAGLTMQVTDGVATLPDGTIAGSTVSLTEAMRRAMRFGIAPARAVCAATELPALAIGRSDLGRVRRGAVADLVLCDEQFYPIEILKGEERK